MHVRLYALHMQATRGDNAEERPMWAERGGLDFEGRARWDAWAAVKGLETEKAKLRYDRPFRRLHGLLAYLYYISMKKAERGVSTTVTAVPPLPAEQHHGWAGAAQYR